MKQNATQFMKSLIILAILVVTISPAFAQKKDKGPRFKFNKPKLESGKENREGAVYRFPKVTPGVDALVTVDNIKGLIEMIDIDRTKDGYDEAFQPEYKINGLLGGGQIDFKIRFVAAGTETSVIQPIVEASGLDIDGQTSGGFMLKEFNQLDMKGGYVDFNKDETELTVTPQGTGFLASNFTGIMRGAKVDTLALGIMFTVVNVNVSEFTYSVGSTGLINFENNRFASLYFSPFTYPGSILPAMSLLNFTGNDNGKAIQLKWLLNRDNDIHSFVVEKSEDAKNFTTKNEYAVKASKYDYDYSDVSLGSKAYYRLKMITTTGQIRYSEVIYFAGTEKSTSNFTVYPSQVNSSLTAQVKSKAAQKASFEVFDFSGRLIRKIPMALMQGQNNIQIADLDRLPAGQYITYIRTKEGNFSQKINKL